MSWLRQRCAETFVQHNPDWELRVVTTPDDMAHHSGLCEAHKADWHRWRLLAAHGGLAIDSDIIWTNPIPDEWLDCDLCAQYTASGDIYQMAAIGTVPGHKLAVDAERYCEKNSGRVAKHTKDPFNPDDSVYQEFGVVALAKITQHAIWRLGSLCRISHEDLCFYDWANGPRQVWGDDAPLQELPETAIGVHWYGGSKESKKHEYAAHAGGPSWLERLASGGA